MLTKLPSDICGHCKERCTCAETGKKGQALCGICVHASCDGGDHYNYLTSKIENIAYLCKLNPCQSGAHFKQLIFKSVKVADNDNDLNSRLGEIAPHAQLQKKSNHYCQSMTP